MACFIGQRTELKVAYHYQSQQVCLKLENSRIAVFLS